jgi:hypothetical protein
MIKVCILDQCEFIDWETSIFVFEDINIRIQYPNRKREKLCYFGLISTVL